MVSRVTYQDLMDEDVIVKRDCILKSGKRSNYYVDIKSTISKPKLFNRILNQLQEQIEINISDVTAYAMVGIPFSGIPFASIMADRLGIPMLLLRNEKKTCGTEKIIEGDCETKDLIIVEDVMTTGGSILSSIKTLTELKYRVKYVFTIFQREPVDYDVFNDLGIKYNYLITKEEHGKRLGELQFKPIVRRLNDYVKEKRSNLILSLDVPDLDRFKEIIDETHQHIVGVKVHLDIFDDGDRETIRSYLREEKEKKRFIVIEDRKFGDICNTNLQQMRAMKIKTYADMVTVHGVSGFEFVKQCKIPVIVVAKLSNSGNLIDDHYTTECLKGSVRNTNVIGVVSQNNLGINSLIYFKPGIRLNSSTDSYDQNYSGRTEGIDMYIVGRGITESEDCGQSAKHYKEYLFDFIE